MDGGANPFGANGPWSASDGAGAGSDTEQPRLVADAPGLAASSDPAYPMGGVAPPPAPAPASAPAPAATHGPGGVWANAPVMPVTSSGSPTPAASPSYQAGAGAGAGAGFGVGVGVGAGAGAGVGDGGLRRRPVPSISLASQRVLASGERFLEVPANPELYQGFVETDVTRVLRYTPSHVKYRSPPNRFARTGRRIKLMVVVTMYAEAPDELTTTLEGIAQNIYHMNKEHKDSNGAAGASWKEIVVVVVSDGIQKINNDTFRLAERLGMARQSMIFQSQFAGIVIPDDVEMHTFSFAPQLEPSTRAAQTKYGARYPPMQTLFCVKEHNGGKLDSHKWFFDAFCARMNPVFVALIDVGTRAASTSIRNLVVAMETDTRVAGCCGEIAVALEDKSMMFTNPVVAAQVFEYKISHCMDKPLESWLGFITVLPGAFSAYRYSALIGEGSTNLSARPPLQKYFASLPDPHRGRAGKPEVQSLWDANMYLAEDRILCFEIVATPGKAYRLEYVKHSPAYTDVPLKLNLLLKQRRRWLNGSFFAMLHALANFTRIFSTTTHSRTRKCMLAFELVYFIINVLITWFLIGSFYLIFKLILLNALPSTTGWLVVEYILTFLYGFNTAVVFILSIGNDPVWTRRAYRWCSILYAALFAIATVAQFISLFSSSSSVAVIVGALLLIAAYFFTAFIHGQLFYIAATLIPYYFMLPTFVMIFTIFSMCNIHDISWGTKGLDTVQKAHQRTELRQPPKPLEQMTDAEVAAWDAQCQLAVDEDRRRLKEMEEANKQTMHQYKWYRTLVVILLIATNWLLVTSVSTWIVGTGHESIFTYALASSVFFMVFARVGGSIMFQLTRVGRATCCGIGRSQAHSQQLLNGSDPVAGSAYQSA